MDSDWLTYREAAERLGSTAEAVRYRANHVDKIDAIRK
jgi:hypothetical protein